MNDITWLVVILIVILMGAFFGIPCVAWAWVLLIRYANWLEKKGWLPRLD